MKTKLFGCLVLVGLASAANAQVTPIGPFTGTAQEGFQVIGQWPPNGPCTFCPSIPDAFGGICTLESATGGNNIHVTGGWGFICSIGANLTPRIAASTSGGFDYHFNAGQGAGKFGGYFGTNSGVAGGTIEFFDASGAMIGSDTLTHPADCSWNWQGWEFSVPVERIRVLGNHGSGGYVQMDDMEYDAGGGTPCYPDCDGDGALSLADFGCFQTKFALADPYADCNNDQVLNLADFGCYQTAFAQGCP